MKRKKFMFISIIIAVVIIVSGLFLVTNMRNTENTKVRVSASWVESFDTLKDMVKSSDLIIVGKVVGQEPEKRHDLIFTNQILEIEKVIKDKRSKNTKDQNNLKVLQTGGTLENKTTPAIDEAPLLKINNEYMLFLRETQEQRFLVMGGFTGSFEIVNDKLNCEDSESGLKNSIKGKNTYDLIKEINSYLAEVPQQ